VEFLMLAAFLLLVFTVVLAYFASLQGREIQDREYALGREVGALVADRVHLAVVAGSGYEAVFSVPPLVAGAYPYDLKLSNRDAFSSAYVDVSWTKGGSQFEYSIPLASRKLCAAPPPIPPATTCSKQINNDYTYKVVDKAKPLHILNNGEWVYVWQE
jgi:hypothetical protein